MTVTQSELQRILRGQDRYIRRLEDIEQQYEEGLAPEEKPLPEEGVTVVISKEELRQILASSDVTSAVLKRILGELKQKETATKIR